MKLPSNPSLTYNNYLLIIANESLKVKCIVPFTSVKVAWHWVITFAIACAETRHDYLNKDYYFVLPEDPYISCQDIRFMVSYTNWCNNIYDAHDGLTNEAQIW
jgi:hypothetical protein